MKYIKNRENYQDYDIDDFVLLKGEFMDKCQIIKKYLYNTFKPSFDVEFDDFIKIKIAYNEIERKLNSEEIEDFKLRRESNKYNI